MGETGPVAFVGHELRSSIRGLGSMHICRWLMASLMVFNWTPTTELTSLQALAPNPWPHSQTQKNINVGEGFVRGGGGGVTKREGAKRWEGNSGRNLAHITYMHTLSRS